jgi:signal transduction histidine kinase
MVGVDHAFAQAARESLDAFERRSAVATTLAVTTPNDRLPIPTENELLRILQEALHNVEKHAKASQVWVTWDVSPDVARLVVSDNGRGFDIRTGVRDSAYGLAGMRERADAVSGRLDVHSTPGSGTTIQVTIPRRRTPVPGAATHESPAPDNGVTR